MPKTPPDHPDGLARLRAVVHDLRSPGGCPWDIEQTHASLVPNLLEEAYEAAEAIRSGDDAHMREELGDLLLQCAMHAEIAAGRGAFDLDAMAHGIADKLVHRHPHVYGESDAADPEAVLKQWDEIKRAEKGAEASGWLEGITAGLPALIRAAKIQKRAAKAGFDWPDPAGVLDKVREETAEVEQALASGQSDAIAEEIGDLLFTAVNLARKAGFDAEALLAATNEKFIRRFHAMEEKVGDLKAASLDEMEAAWREAAKAG